MRLPCLNSSESSSDQPSEQELYQDGSTVGLVDIRPAALLLPSSGDSELDSDIDAGKWPLPYSLLVILVIYTLQSLLYCKL